MHLGVGHGPAAQQNLAIVTVGGCNRCCSDSVVSEHALEHGNWVLTAGCAARVDFLQCQNVGVGAADECEHAIEIMAAVGPHAAMNVPGHDPDG